MRMLLLVGCLAVVGCGKGKGASGPGGMNDPVARLKGVPAQAFMVGVLELTDPPMASLGLLLDEKSAADMIAELDAYLRKKVGISLAKARSITIFGSPENGAALIPFVDGTLVGTSTGEHMGVKLYPVVDDLVAAQADGLLIVGQKESVVASLDVLAGRAPPLTRAKPEMAALFAREAKDAPLAIMVSGAMLGMALGEEGLEAGIVVAQAEGLRAQIRGREAALRSVGDKLKQATAMLDQGVLGAEPPEDDVIAHAAFILTRHHVQFLKRALVPRINGEALTIQVPFRGEDIMGVYAFTSVVGMLAAVAIPAFMKNARKAKTSEAAFGIRRLFDGARAHAEANGRFPKASARPTPPLDSCCSQPGKKCAPDPKLWASAPWTDLQFSVDDPSYYSFAYVSNGTAFTASAHGDLDCDGVYSTFEMVGSIQADGSVTEGAGLFRDNELE